VAPRRQEIPLNQAEGGYWQATIDDIPPGTCYFYVLGRTMDRTDPASQFQPEGVHGPSEVVDHEAFHWTDAGWEGVPLEDMLIYELHVGTFTRKANMTVQCLPQSSVLMWHRKQAQAQFQGILNFSDEAQPFSLRVSRGRWTKVLDSADDPWAGPGAVAPAQVDGPQQITVARKSIVVFAHASLEAAQTLAAAQASIEIVEETNDADSAGDLQVAVQSLVRFPRRQARGRVPVGAWDQRYLRLADPQGDRRQHAWLRCH